MRVKSLARHSYPSMCLPCTRRGLEAQLCDVWYLFRAHVLVVVSPLLEPAKHCCCALTHRAVSHLRARSLLFFLRSSHRKGTVDSTSETCFCCALIRWVPIIVLQRLFYAALVSSPTLNTRLPPNKNLVSSPLPRIARCRAPTATPLAAATRRRRTTRSTPCSGRAAASSRRRRPLLRVASRPRTAFRTREMCVSCRVVVCHIDLFVQLRRT